MTDKRIQLKVKVKSLAAEARIIRKEERKAVGWLRNSLRGHRIRELRSAARHALIVYAFVRGREYSQVERNAKTDPDRSRIKRDAKKFGRCYDFDNEDYTTYRNSKVDEEIRLEAWLATITTREKIAC